MNPPIAQVTLEEFEEAWRGRHLIHAAMDYQAMRTPGEPAILNATRGTELTWGDLRRRSLAVAGALARMGFARGDFLAASAPLADEHIVLEYGCFRLGVIHAPLDLRLPPSEVVRCLGQIGAKGYAFPGKVGGADFSPFGELARRACGSIEHLIQFSPPAECIPGAVAFSDLEAHGAPLPASTHVLESDGAQVIFTTGSTGSPKPALLSHRGITCQNLCLGSAFDFSAGQRVLANLPASHVGGQAELLLTALFMGGTAVTLEVFDAVKSLEAIERYGVTLLGQIPAMFQMEWRTADYGRRDFASLRAAVYGGQAVPRAFLERMRKMAPTIGTGLGLTETSGFCTYTMLTPDVDEVARSIGWSMPAYPLSIREAMNEDGSAGWEMPPGKVGHICFRGPQNFLGYVNDPQATAAVLSRDGWLYTGDMGFVDAEGLHFSGRARWVLKPRGYQVFPGDIESHFSNLTDLVASVGVVGHPHELWSEALVAFVEKRPEAVLSEADLRRHARGLASYMRPLHYVVLEPGAMPLNRSAKVDIARLQEMAKEEVRALRARGRWDNEEP